MNPYFSFEQKSGHTDHDYDGGNDKDYEQDEDDIQNNIKQISMGGHRSLSLNSKKNCVGSCSTSNVHNGCKYGFSCKVIFCVDYFIFQLLSRPSTLNWDFRYFMNK